MCIRCWDSSGARGYAKELPSDALHEGAKEQCE